MPIIINSSSPHPFFPSLGSGSAIAQERAAHQDIRPLEIVVLNLMADKISTEKQLAYWLGHTPLQINLTFAATDRYISGLQSGRESRNTPSAYIRQHYQAFRSLRDQKFDGLIVTGVNALKARVSEEEIWPDVEEIFKWSATHAFSSLFLCWGAKAALKHFHNIESYKGKEKLFGVYEHYCLDDKAGLLFGFPDRFPIPVSRWKSPDAAAIAKCAPLEIVAASQVGPTVLAECASYDNGKHYPKRVYVLGHPEYETNTLLNEYNRDRVQDVAASPPHHYFPDDDASRAPLNTWRFTGALYANWLATIYDASPYNLDDIPLPFAS